MGSRIWTRSLGAPITSTTSIELVTKHRLLAELVVRREFGASTLTQTYRMRAGSALRHRLRHRLATSEKLLSLMVPLDVLPARRHATIQFGHVKRPPTSAARGMPPSSRCAAHRFVDFSEPMSGRGPERRSLGHGIRTARRCVVVAGREVSRTLMPTPAHAVTISVLPRPGIATTFCTRPRP